MIDHEKENLTYFTRVLNIVTFTGSVTSTGNDDYNEFLADLEEDPELRQNVNVYKDAKKIAVDTESEVADSDQEAFPQITLAEMLDDLVLEEMDS